MTLMCKQLLMKHYILWLGMSVVLSAQASTAPEFPADTPAWQAAAVEPAAVHLARPSTNQIDWQEQERTLFVCFGIATYEGREYDADGQTDLTKIDPKDFDADAICLAAKSWGAKQVLLVASHVGGFCLWPTETSDYHIGNTPWRDGKGNMVKEVADACRRHGLNMGLYLYPDDTRFAKGFGRAGRTDDPADQETWNRQFIQRWEEILTICGPDLVNEIWLDGGCVIDVIPTVKRLAPRAVVFNKGDYERVRWPGNEKGVVPEVNWSSIDRDTLLRQRGGAYHGSDPDGDTWAPFECDTPLYDHNWFWHPRNEAKRKSLAHLMHTYVKSVGNGAVLLLNATPNTDGVLPEGDRLRYKEFGEAIERNFGQPLAQTEGAVIDKIALCPLKNRKQINCVDIWEDYRLGHRIRSFVVEGYINGQWKWLAEGKSVGRRKLLFFPTVETDRVRVRVTESVGTPVFRSVRLHRVEDGLAQTSIPPVSSMATVTTSTIHSSGYEGFRLIDNNARTRWAAKDGDPDPWVELDLGREQKFAGATFYELADRVRAFRILTRNDTDQPWRTVHEGTTIGRVHKVQFERVTGRFVRLHILKYEGPAPTLFTWDLHDRPEAFETVGLWQAGEQGNWNLSTAINEAGAYEVRFIDGEGQVMKVASATLMFEGGAAKPEDLSGVGSKTLVITRTQAIGPGASSSLRAVVEAPQNAKGRVQIRPLN